MNLGHRATVSLVSDPFFLHGKRVFDGSDASVGIPSEDNPPRVRDCYRGVRPLISRHFPQDLWKPPQRTRAQAQLAGPEEIPVSASPDNPGSP